MFARVQVDIFLIDTLYDFAKPYAVNDRRLVRDGLIHPAPAEAVRDCLALNCLSNHSAIFPPLLAKETNSFVSVLSQCPRTLGIGYQGGWRHDSDASSIPEVCK